MKFTPLDEKEKVYLSEEVLNRLKDIFFMQSENKVKEMVGKVSALTFHETDTIHFSYEITMVGDDILQIIGRKRRLE